MRNGPNPGTSIGTLRSSSGEISRKAPMKTISLTLAALVISGSVIAAQTSTTPRIDDEGIKDISESSK